MPDKRNQRKLVPTLVLHGGAGRLCKKNLSEIQEQTYRQTITDILEHGKTLLTHQTPIETAIQLVCLLENTGLFTAGKGAMPNDNGFVELDAAVMQGKDQSVGAVSGIQNIKNPILAAEYVRTQTPHVLIAGEGTKVIVEKAALEKTDSTYYQDKPLAFQPDLWGTVGVIAMNEHAEFAAATSTGGTIGKMQGRVGDTPIIGAGIFAQDGLGAVLCTGFGEYFLRTSAAFDAIALIKYKKYNIKRALHRIIWSEIDRLGGKGGMIGIDTKGNVGLQCNTDGMICGFVKGNKQPIVKIFRKGILLH